MNQTAPQRRRQPHSNGFQFGNTQAPVRKRRERVAYLPLYGVRTPCNKLIPLHGGRRIVCRLLQRIRADQIQGMPTRIRRLFMSHSGISSDQRTCGVFRFLAGALPAQSDPVSTAHQPLQYSPCIVQGVVRCRIRHRVLSLQLSGDECQWVRRRRPGVRVKTGNPDPVESHAGSFKRPQQPDDAGLCLRLINRVTGQRSKTAARLGKSHLWTDDLQPGQVIEQFAPAIDELEFIAGERSGAWPRELQHQLIYPVCPCRRARLLRSTCLE